ERRDGQARLSGPPELIVDERGQVGGVEGVGVLAVDEPDLREDFLRALFGVEEPGPGRLAERPPELALLRHDRRVRRWGILGRLHRVSLGLELAHPRGGAPGDGCLRASYLSRASAVLPGGEEGWDGDRRR